MLMFLTSLFLTELIVGVSNALDLKWVVDGKLSTGGFCTAQGAIKQLGNAALGLATFIIAVVNFVTIWWKKKSTRTIALMIIGGQWLFVILFVAIGFAVHTHPSDNEYYATPDPFWCWLGSRYKNKEGIAGEYVWLWLALFGSIVLYVPLFLWYLGVIAPDPNYWYKFKLGSDTQAPQNKANLSPPQLSGYAGGELRPNRRNPTLPYVEHADENDEDSEDHHYSEVPNPAQKQRPELGATIWYPVIFCFIVLPLSVVRMISFNRVRGDSIPAAATLVVESPLALSGALNSALYLVTRRRLLWGGGRPKDSESTARALFHTETPPEEAEEPKDIPSTPVTGSRM